MNQTFRLFAFLVVPMVIEAGALYFIYNNMAETERAAATAQLQSKLDEFASGIDVANYIIPETPDGVSTAVFDISQEMWEPIKISASFPYTQNLPVGVNFTDSLTYITTELEGMGPKFLVSMCEDATALNQKEAFLRQMFLVIFGIGAACTMALFYWVGRKR